MPLETRTPNTQMLPTNVTLGVGPGVYSIWIPLVLASMTTGAADLMTGFIPGHAGKILKLEFVTTTLGTGSGASQVLNLEIGSTNLTGGVLTLLLADTTPLGKITAATAITAGNEFTATDAISLEVAASGTVFTAGSGALIITIQNLQG
jgi:hypothetical protein